jgi:hypothetical protein
VDVFQCFRCELKFASRPELEAHLRDDHDLTTATPDDDQQNPEPDAPPTT